VIPHPVRTNLIISTRGLTSMAILMSFSALIVMVNMALPAFAEISTAQTQMIKPNPADWEEFQKTVDALGGNQQEKENLLRGWLSHYPDDLEARFYLARVLSWQGNYQESLKQYEMLLQQFPQNADYLLGKASVLIWRNTPEQAIAVLEPAIAKNPDYVDLYRTKLRALQQWAQTEKSKVQEAEAFRKEVQQRFPAEKWPTLPEEELPPVELETDILTGAISIFRLKHRSVNTTDYTRALSGPIVLTKPTWGCLVVPISEFPTAGGKLLPKAASAPPIPFCPAGRYPVNCRGSCPWDLSPALVTAIRNIAMQQPNLAFIRWKTTGESIISPIRCTKAICTMAALLSATWQSWATIMEIAITSH
jgi:tetratricopeptide (TPR) repeat protein